MHQVEHILNEKYLVSSASTKAQAVHARLSDKKGAKNVIRWGRQNILRGPAFIYTTNIFLRSPTKAGLKNERPGRSPWGLHNTEI
jgi:hypothetical protein